MRTRADIVRTALSLVDAPYKRRGRSVHGCDCGGLVSLCGGFVGSPLDRFELDPANVKEGAYAAVLDASGFVRIPKEARQPGDLVTFHWRSRPTIETHFGIVTDYGMVHATEHRVAEVRLTGGYLDRLHAAYAFPGVSLP